MVSFESRSVLYIGPDAGTCRARFEALRRLGHNGLLVDPFAAIPASRYARSWSFKTGGFGFGALVRRHIAHIVGSSRFDLAYVDSGELIGRSTVEFLHRYAPLVVNYNPDNPYVVRDGYRWRAFRSAVPAYDHLFVPRLSNVEQARDAGARNVTRVWFAADDPLKERTNLPDRPAMEEFRSALSFVGTWMPERGPFLLKLVEAGLPLRILGPRWDRAPEWQRLRSRTRLGELGTQAYTAAVAAADISIALLSKGNHDLHTTRSMEIPVVGSLLCGERTSEHSALYAEGEQAIFWDSADECIRQCRALIDDPPKRARIAAAGRKRALDNNHFNEPLMHGMITNSIAGPRL